VAKSYLQNIRFAGKNVIHMVKTNYWSSGHMPGLWLKSQLVRVEGFIS